MKTCIYCYEWNRSSVVKRSGKGENTTVTKFCKETGMEIESKDESCKKFKPCTSFFCDRNEFFITFEICRNRYNKCRFGDKTERNLYSNCEKCKQFKKYVKPICNEYKITTPQIVKIQRRDSPKEIQIKRRKITKTIIQHRSRS